MLVPERVPDTLWNEVRPDKYFDREAAEVFLRTRVEHELASLERQEAFLRHTIEEPTKVNLTNQAYEMTGPKLEAHRRYAKSNESSYYKAYNQLLKGEPELPKPPRGDVWDPVGDFLSPMTEEERLAGRPGKDVGSPAARRGGGGHE